MQIPVDDVGLGKFVSPIIVTPAFRFGLESVPDEHCTKFPVVSSIQHDVN